MIEWSNKNFSEMKNKILLLIQLLMVTLISSCIVEDEPQGGGDPPTPNALTTSLSTGTSVALSQDDADDIFSELTWTATDFKGKPVKYSIEMDLVGNDFSKAKDILTTDDLGVDLTVQNINAALIAYGIDPGEVVNVELRVRSWVDFLTTPGLSNKIEYTLTPYLLVFPPIYIVGDAQAWNLDNAVELTSNTPSVYKGTGKFQTNGKFRFFEIADWGAQQWGWSYFAAGGTVPGEFGDGADGDSNFLFQGLTTNYNITVSLLEKKITIEPSGPPPPPASLFLVTSSLIDLNEAVEIAGTDGVYKKVLVLTKNTKFRLFTSRSWSADKLGWNFFDDTLIDSDLGNSGDDVSNFIFLSDVSEYYEITITLTDKSITVEPAAPPFPATLLINGDAQGWSFDNAVVLLSSSVGVYEGIAKFQTGGVFRFFGTNDWVQPQWGWNYFTSVAGVFTDGGGGDSNINFPGATRYYKITVSLIAKTITVSDPVLLIVGDDQSWGFGNAVQLTWQSGGTFTATTTFTNNSTFRMFVKPDWGLQGNEYRYTSFTTVDGDFTNGGGADANFVFNGTTGSHTLTVDLLNSTVVIN